MLPEELFLSLCRLQHPGDQLVSLGSRDLSAVQTTLALGALMGPGRRRPSHAQSCFPAKENTWGVGFRLQRPTAKQQGQGARGSPSPLFPTSSGSLGAKTACVAFLRKGAVGLVLLREECFLPFADCRAQELGWCLWRVGGSARIGPASLGLYCWGMGEEGLCTFHLASP